jgi:hypothetical protein
MPLTDVQGWRANMGDDAQRRGGERPN